MGYPSDIVFVSTPIPDCCLCIICHEVMEAPISLQQCGHTFCQTCIDMYQSSSSSPSQRCPMCRVPITGTHPNFFARDTIDMLQVKCPHHQHHSVTTKVWECNSDNNNGDLVITEYFDCVQYEYNSFQALPWLHT